MFYRLEMIIVFIFNDKYFFSKEIGIIIKQKRINEKKLTLSQFANQCDMDPKTLWRIEEGHIITSCFNLLKIFYLLNIRADDYLKILLQEDTK